jgi:hypothetical protein
MTQVLSLKKDVMCSENWPLAEPAAIKAINPVVKIYCYYALSAKNFATDVDGTAPNGTIHQLTPLPKAMIDANNWWLRDGNGQIVEETSGCWFLDVGKPGFKEAYLANLLTRMSGRKLDGIIFDYWTPGLAQSYLSAYMNGRPMPADYPTDASWYTNAWQPFIAYVMAGVHNAGYRIIGNCAGEYMSGNPRCDWQRTQIDGAIYEKLAIDYPNGATPGSWLPATEIDTRIQHLSSDPQEAWAVDYGLMTADPMYTQKDRVSLAMYYIAIPVSQTYRSYGQYGNCKVYWDSLWNFNIGVPAAAYTKSSSYYFYSRKYTRGLVLLNYESTATISFKLDKTYVDPDGHMLSGTISVPPHTGVILENS